MHIKEVDLIFLACCILYNKICSIKQKINQNNYKNWIFIDNSFGSKSKVFKGGGG